MLVTRRRALVARGFTLIEMAVVLFIFGLLIAGFLGPLETQLEARDRTATIETIDEILESLYGFALTNGRLPCPDSDGDGRSDPLFDPANSATANCDGGSDFDDGEGFIPAAELSVAPGDAWSNRFRYRVRWPNYTLPDTDGICDGDTAPEEFDLCSNSTPELADIDVRTRGDNPATSGVAEGKTELNIATGVPAVVISHGRNGFGATAVSGAVRPTPAGGTDEAVNSDGDNDNVYYSRAYTRGSSGCADDTDEAVPLCQFDDIVMWLSPAVLSNRMVTSGRLP